ncbi:hypothetical protein SEVIR_7G148000v4 [Setaria viridis]|uniref:Bowman-Birk serine protease inhibitors family domain-containing protein n=2 Tax=Setaria TaxID=4554 RepID=K3YAA9_SETIT|nr:Bowman-Birk type bran trypsin inhibitor [Setaria italica]XP_034602501.1 Bowman-Birk type bran trypsin inhibitor-like [Setaria viridis]RCV34187.1 hypothetical protein SETIT_7G140700v2 [Setaria italica]TKW05013.1 hypothetical protein SEVIR_7G148000v2 [Setaria viridis]
MKSSGAMGTTTPAVVLATMLVVALHVGLAAATHSDTDTIIRLPTGVRGDDSPWECCDFIERDPSFRPPRWQCNDVLGECSANCKKCEEALAGDGYVCRDWVTSIVQPPVCTPRPWDCCDFAVCTRAYVPTCWCADKVDKCSSHCKDCSEVEKDPRRYRCLDRFLGYPGPKCTPWSSKEEGN